MPDIRFLGHATFELTHGGATVLVDPFLTSNPKAAASADELDATTILVTHGHADHFEDVVSIARRTGATVVAITELADELSGEGLDAIDANLGGTSRFDWGWVRRVPAWHTAVSPKGTPHTPSGLVIGMGDRVVYHLGDTCLFSDLQLVRRRTPVDVALVPIGGHYTMDRIDAVDAVELVAPKQVIPCHYDTFPPIETDVAQFEADVSSRGLAEVIVLEPGATHSV